MRGLVVGLLALALLALGLVATTACDEGIAARADSDVPSPPPSVRTAMRVRVAPALEGSAAGIASATGVTSAFRSATVSAEVAGRVTARHVEPGSAVKKGDPLVVLDTTQLQIAVDEAKANLAAGRADLAEAKRQRERGDYLREQNTMSERQHDNLRYGLDRAAAAVALADAALRRAQESVSDAVVRAPFDGTVEVVSVQTGDYLAPGTPVSTLVDFEKVRVRAGVTASEADTLAPGMTARLSIPALGGLERDVAVQSVGRVADPRTGTYPVEIWIDNEDGRLRSGLVAQLRFAPPKGGTTGPLVPRGALVRRNGQLVVFVIEGDGESARAAKRPVRLGRQIGERVEILGGVDVGERVVTDGLFALQDGASVVIDGDAA